MRLTTHIGAYIAESFLHSQALGPVFGTNRPKNKPYAKDKKQKTKKVFCFLWSE